VHAKVSISDDKDAAGATEWLGQCPALEPFIETGFPTSKIVHAVRRGERKRRA